MLTRLTAALRQVRGDMAGLLGRASLARLCRAEGLRWRDRVLDPVTTVHLFLLQVLNGNAPVAHVPRLAGRQFTASAYCQARARLPLAVCQALLRRLADLVEPVTDTCGLWRGHRTWLIDGSGVSMPDAPALAREFGYPPGRRPGCGFPVAKVLALFHAGTGMVRSLLAAKSGTHDLSQVRLAHPEMRAGDVLVGGRAHGSFAHLAVPAGRGLFGVFRMHQKRVVDFTSGRRSPPRWKRKKLSGKARSGWVKSLGERDQVVDWHKPYPKAAWLPPEECAALPKLLRARETRYSVGRPGFRVSEVTPATTLLDAGAYPAEALAELYRSRWRVETDLRHLKATMGMDVLRCRTPEGVRKELALYAAAYSLARLVMLEAARRQGVPPERVSFVDGLRWLASSPVGTPLPRLRLNPERPGRVEPRCRKRRGKNFPYMTEPRAELRKRLLAQRDTA